MAAETVEGSCKENLAGKLWTHCGRLRAGGPSGGRAELSRAGGHGRRRTRRRGPASGRTPRGEKQCADFGRIFGKHARRAGVGKGAGQPRPGQRRAEQAGQRYHGLRLIFVRRAERREPDGLSGARGCRHCHRPRRPAHILLVGVCGWGASRGRAALFSGEQGVPRHALPPRLSALPRAPHKAHGICDAGAGCKAVPVGAHDCGPAGKAVCLCHGALYSCRKPRCALRGSVSAFSPHDEGPKMALLSFGRFFYRLVCAECVHAWPAGYSVHLALPQSRICRGIYGAAQRGEEPCFSGGSVAV